MYDHRQVEKEILSFWEKKEIMKKVNENNKNGEPFYFADGPPYATGQIHPGTGWNKTLKDTVCRYWRLKGRKVRAQAGFDTHGLPIEVKVEQELKIKNKNEIEKYGMEKFIEKCKKFATKYIGVMSKQFLSLGVWLDFENPYITYKDSYIESSWQTLKMAWEKELMHEGFYVLPYCYRCETTMANYELEYGEETDPSIYVKFKVKGKENEYLIIWTTTPWTLVANMGVMAHPTHKYVKVQVDGEVWILAKDLLDPLMELIDKSATILEEVSGRKLNDMQYEHPFQHKLNKEYDRKVVLSDEYVSVEEGTGLVHTAPGTGPEDFIIGKRFGIEPFCPLDEKGEYTEEAGADFVGKNVRSANLEIIELLDSLGVLVREQRIKHRYPHCWRCKTPLIFKTTKQWFISISKIKDKMMNEITNTNWHPNFAKERFKEFVTGAPDWCISRQRFWGIPLPIWKCVSCDKVTVVGSKKELPKVKELHRPYIDKIELDCKCGNKMTRVSDVLDVWFDSGNSIWASFEKGDSESFGDRADVIIEGQDQIRGWFYSLLGSGVIRYNACPYKNLLMHGFFVDEHGEKMSKSVGNFIPLENILEKYGADSFRLWGMSNTTWDELKFSWDEIKKASSDLNILSNVITFMERFYVSSKKSSEQNAEDKWISSRLHTTIKSFNKNMKNYDLNKASKTMRSFLVDDVSRFYMKLAKDRVQRKDNADAALQTLFEVLFESLKMFSIFSPFISEYLYRKFFMKYMKKESLFLHSLADEDPALINTLMEKQMEIVREVATVALTARQDAGVKLRWPIRSLVVETKSHEVMDAVATFKSMLGILLNTKEVIAVDKEPKGEFTNQEFSSGKVYVNKKLDEELYEEGMLNEIKRRVQSLRKEAGLIEKDKVVLHVDTEKEVESIIKKMEKQLLTTVNATDLVLKPDKKMKEYQIDGRLVRLSVKKT